MGQNEETPEAPEAERNYLDVRPPGPGRWVLLVGALFLVLALAAAFFGLFAINRGPSPTLSPDPAVLTRVAAEAAATGSTAQATLSAVPLPGPSRPSATATPAITATTAPPTYTVQQGDTLIAIAHNLNVNVDALTALNRLGGETIFPSQVLLVPPTVTPWPETGPFRHTVSQGETLISIALRYQVGVDEIKALNGLSSDVIFVGQTILIPDSAVLPPTPTPAPTPWVAAVITGELDAVYTLSTSKGRFTLHVSPESRAAAANELDRIARLVETALAHSQDVLQLPFSGRFDVYVTDTLFDAPYTSRRSFSLPDQRRLFLLYDSSGTPTERLYFVTYGLAPLIAAQSLGAAASPLLREGLAVYTAGQNLAAGATQSDRYLSPGQFCAAYQQAAELPQVSGELTLQGHLGHLDQHLAAGCFVGYLIETRGAAAFREVYLTGDFNGVYGKTLSQLESDWIAALESSRDAGPPLNAAALVPLTNAVNDAYRRLWPDFSGTPLEFAAYSRLDRARVSLLQGRLGTAQQHLEAFEALLSEQ